MRIVKLSSEYEFANVDEVDDYFENIGSRNPPGQFRITEGRIAADGLEIGERLIFSYQAAVYYIAQAASGRKNNSDELHVDYPYFFLINLDTLHRIEPISFDEIRQLLGQLHWGRGQGWKLSTRQNFKSLIPIISFELDM
jgi:hypothetical protein